MMDGTDLIHTLREGKELLRRTRRSASLDEKLHDLWRAQHIYVQVVGSRRQLMPWERPWNIMNDVRDGFVISDVTVTAGTRTRLVSASRSRWVRPQEQWVLPA